jgi:ClpX C4-type zinc finger
MSEIRKTLAAAQRAENQGDLPEAIRLLRSVAEVYAERGMTARAEQMRRQMARLQEAVQSKSVGSPVLNAASTIAATTPPPSVDASDDGFGFGEVFSPEPRGPLLCSPTESAWCSFCCLPGSDVGRLVTGPTGAFICGACASSAHSLIEDLAPSTSATGAAVREKLQRLSALSAESGRLTGELASLVARIPAEGYEPP